MVIKTKDSTGRTINIEVQFSRKPSSAFRSLCCWARNYQQQLEAAQFCGTLAPAVCISLVNSALFPELEDFHTCFHITERDRPEYILSEDLQIHFIEIEKLEGLYQAAKGMKKAGAASAI